MKIKNTSDFKTYVFLISLDQVRDLEIRDKLRKSCKTSHKNKNAVFVNARAFNYLDLLVYLKSNFGMTTNNVLSLKPKIVENKPTKVYIDLTFKVFDSNSKNVTFYCKIDKLRSLYKTINKQTTIYNPKFASLLNILKNSDDRLDTIVVNFNVDKMKPNHFTPELKDFKDILINTGYVVPIDESNNNLIYADIEKNFMKDLINENSYDYFIEPCTMSYDDFQKLQNDKKLEIFDNTKIGDAVHMLTM